MVITSTDFQNVELAIAAYTDEAYVTEKKLTSTGIVAAREDIRADGESYIGQMRHYDPISANVNVPSLSSSTDGTFSDISTTLVTYIKAARSWGVDQVNLQEVVSRQNGLLKFARDFAELKAQDSHNGVLSVLKGVAASEAALAEGYVDFDSANDAALGFFVDINALGEFGAAATGAGDERKLIDASALGAARGSRLFKAMGMAFGDHEPDYMYMVTSPEMMAELREANLVDETVVEDGNLVFQTIFGGKFRLLMTRAAQGDRSGDTNVNARSAKTTFLIKPGSVALNEFDVPNPVEIDRNASSYLGGGNTEVWYRSGHILHPVGYTWAGATNAFATNANYATAASWTRAVNPLNLGILPIFHA